MFGLATNGSGPTASLLLAWRDINQALWRPGIIPFLFPFARTITDRTIQHTVEKLLQITLLDQPVTRWRWNHRGRVYAFQIMVHVPRV